MKKTSEEYIEYLKQKKDISLNTQVSYRNDLKKMTDYFTVHKLVDYEMISVTNINSYILYLELQGTSTATIIRNIAVIKGYFDYLFREHKISNCITDEIKRPVYVANKREKLSEDEINKLLEVVKGNGPKERRDYALIQLLVTAKIPISQLLDMTVKDVDFEMGYIQCNLRKKIKTYRIEDEVLNSLTAYVEDGRDKILKDRSTEILFLNMKGVAMSRQGAWKIIKTHSKVAGIEDINLSRLNKGNEA